MEYKTSGSIEGSNVVLLCSDVVRCWVLLLCRARPRAV